ncbi:MAG: alpha/beta hydrolase [Clostridia bacterium]|nr:alpha/beta hydrolase [Clostridia bacterium]
MKYLKFGDSKKYLVFLHGWGADKNSFLWLKNQYKEYSIIFVDFAGFGETPEPSRPYSVYDYVSELKELLDNFYIESLVLIGHSFGGRVAIKFSFLFQNDYHYFKLCLVDSAGIKPKRNLSYYYKIYKYKFLKHYFPKSKKLFNYGSSDYKKLSKIMKQTLVKVVNEDLSNYAKFITVKTLIIWGENDKETKLYMAKKLNKLIKNSSLVIIKDTGHFSFIEKPYEFIFNLDMFLRN